MATLGFIFSSTLWLSGSLAPVELVKHYEDVEVNSPDHKTAIEELLKIYYQDSRWEKFFAYALYYRTAFESQERSDVQLLEMLALLRHCQNQPLERLAAGLRSDRPGLSSTIDQILSLSRTRFQGKGAKQTKVTTSPLLAHFEGRSFTKVQKANLRNLSPRKLIVRVENLCE